MGKGKEVPAAAVPKKLSMPEKATMSRQKGDPGIKPKFVGCGHNPYKEDVGSPSPKRPPNRTVK